MLPHVGPSLQVGSRSRAATGPEPLCVRSFSAEIYLAGRVGSLAARSAQGPAGFGAMQDTLPCQSEHLAEAVLHELQEIWPQSPWQHLSGLG